MRTESSPEDSTIVEVIPSRIIASRSDVTKSVLGIAQKPMAAPSPVSRMMRSLRGMSLIA
jgi:hypothetical protein